jgi:hypothetical protein
MRNALLTSAGRVCSIAVSTNSPSGIFFCDDLDRPNQLEIADENRVLAHMTAGVSVSPGKDSGLLRRIRSSQ